MLPKFHCELRPIERCWGQLKRYITTNYTFPNLHIPLALDTVTLEKNKNYFRKERQYIFGYVEGLDAVVS